MVTRNVFLLLVIMMITMKMNANGDDTNHVFDPCSDAKVQKKDGFTFGLAFSSKESFFSNNVQLSPCDSRLSLSGGNSQLAVFRPKVDEISLLSINSSNFSPVCASLFTCSLLILFSLKKSISESFFFSLDS